MATVSNRHANHHTHPLKTLCHLLLALLLAAPLAAQAPDDLSINHLDRFKSGNFQLHTLVEVIPMMADPTHRNDIRATLLEAENPPVKDLVALLRHPMLATRLGALEILEELAGGDLTYNPWIPAESPENAGALARWDAWAERPSRAENSSLFSADQRRSYLQDILGDDADKSSRARRMLEAEGISAIGFLEEFLQQTETLPTGHRTRIREAQYQITLSRSLGEQAAVTARHLTFGSRDQILAALTTIRSAGLDALPIIRDFITHPDALVRETAIDALLATGGRPAVPVIAPLVRDEPDVNVIHGILRRLKDIPGKDSSDLVASFLDHPDEDLLISAIQTSLTLSGDQREISFSSFGRSSRTATASPADEKVIRSLDDPRWRVRAAALEYVAKRRLTKTTDICIKMLEDPDDFVRFAAIAALSALEAKQALPRLKQLFLEDESMAGPVIQGYGNMSQTPDSEILNALDRSTANAKLAAIRAAESSKYLGDVLLRLSADPDLDVACAALRAIAANRDLVGDNSYATALVNALRSNEIAKTEAVLERLRLPETNTIDPRVMQALQGAFAEIETTALDPLYQAFLEPGADTAQASGPAAPTMPAAQAELTKELIRRTTPENPPATRFRAAITLAGSSQPEGFATLTRDMPDFTTAQKIAVGEALYNPSVQEAIPILTELLRSPVPEIRERAARAALSNDSAPAFLTLVLNELARPDTTLLAHEIYGYPFESLVRSGNNSTHLARWAIGILSSENPQPASLQILATIALRSSMGATTTNALTPLTQSENPLVRRAALHTLLTVQPTLLNTYATTIAEDPHAFVRIILPSTLNATDGGWSHQFSDLHEISDNRWSHNETKPRLTPELREILAKMAVHDPSERVRFEAGFALLTQNVEIDVNSFAATIPPLPKDAQAPQRLSRWFSQNAARATPGLRPLLSFIDLSRISPADLRTIQSRVSPPTKSGFATFASLAEADKTATESTALLDPATEPDTPVERESLTLIYFFNPGCPECVRAKQDIDLLKADFPLLTVREHNLLESSSTLLNQILCQRFTVPTARHGIAPSLFAQAGFLIRDDINPQSIAQLLADTMALSQDDTFFQIEEADEQAAAEIIDRRYAAFTLPIVIGAGLLDGINPCAFATIIFFLSYLQIARRTPREMLMVGAAFISAVFLAYLAAGLILHQFLATINDRFAGIQFWMNLTFAALALLAAWLSFRDALRARAGRLGDMTLQLPSFLKDRIRATIRKTSRARHFVIAAFISGIIISLLELACTGQVYAPIIYQIQQGNLNALLWLVIYNLAFITPLIIIFILAYSGLRSETLVAFQQKHTFSVKLSLGILFLLLAAFILLAPRFF